MPGDTNSGTVWWLTGLPGAGKTTVARALRERLARNSQSPILLDGDDLRTILGVENQAYAAQDRLKLATSYARLCGYLSSQGFDVVCATVSLFNSIHEWNRQNIHQYVEVLIRAPSSVLRQRDQKGLYTGIEEGKASEVPGIDLNVEFPQEPDLIIDNDGSRSPEELIEILLAGSASIRNSSE